MASLNVIHFLILSVLAQKFVFCCQSLQNNLQTVVNAIYIPSACSVWVGVFWIRTHTYTQQSDVFAAALIPSHPSLLLLHSLIQSRLKTFARIVSKISLFFITISSGIFQNTSKTFISSFIWKDEFKEIFWRISQKTHHFIPYVSPIYTSDWEYI